MQLRHAIREVFDSWMGDRAIEYRRINGSRTTGHRGERPADGLRQQGGELARGRVLIADEITGAPEPSGDFLVNAQGEDVVSVRTHSLDDMKQVMPKAHAELMHILRTLEAHYRDMQDTEFTVEEGRLFMLQTRNAKRPAQAAVRFAVDAVEEQLLEREALATIDARTLDALLHPTRPDAEFDVLSARTPRPAPPRERSSSPRTTPSQRLRRAVTSCLFDRSRRPTTWPLLRCARGILTSEGGKASHAALVARGTRRPAVCGAATSRSTWRRGRCASAKPSCGRATGSRSTAPRES